MHHQSRPDFLSKISLLLEYPLPLAVLAFMAGIAAALPLEGLLGASSPRMACAAFALFFGLNILVLRRLSARKALLFTCLPLLLCTGLVHGTRALERIFSPRASGLAREFSWRSKVTLYGRILEMPEESAEFTRFTLEVWAFLRHQKPDETANKARPPDDLAGFQPLSGKVLVRIRGAVPQDVRAGAEVFALGWAETPRKQQALYYAAKGLGATLWLSGPEALRLLPADREKLGAKLRFGPERLRQKTACFLSAHLAPATAGIYEALLLGSYQAVPPEILEYFKKSGCMHILAISGLHVGLVAALAAALILRLCRRSERILLSGQARALALSLPAPPLFFYACLAGLNIPVLRALLSAFLMLAVFFLARRCKGFHILSLAALIVLALRPLSLFTASFQLSFSALCAILFIWPRLPFFGAPARTGPEKQCSAGWGGRFLSASQAMLGVSLAATLGNLPAMLFHFNRVSLIGPFMNLAVEPLLCLWALPLGLAGLALIPLSPTLALFCLHLGELGIKAALFLLEEAARFPWASVWAITPTAPEIVLYLALLFVLFRPGHEAGAKYIRFLAFPLAALLVLSLSAPLWSCKKTHELNVSFLDVGQGAATLITLPGGRHWLIDCGGFSQGNYEVGSRIVAPFLWRRRIWRLNGVLISHADSDHYSGLPFILEHFSPQAFYAGKSPAGGPAYQQLLGKARALGIDVDELEEKRVIATGPGFALTALALAPEDETPETSENDRSLLVRLDFGRRAFFFPGDSELTREKLLMRDASLGRLKLGADVLLAGHHGSIGSTGPDFLAAVAPKAIIVSSAAARWGRHPDSLQLSRWQQLGIPVFSTARDGVIEARTNGGWLCLSGEKSKGCLCLEDANETERSDR